MLTWSINMSALDSKLGSDCISQDSDGHVDTWWSLEATLIKLMLKMCKYRISIHFYKVTEYIHSENLSY